MFFLLRFSFLFILFFISFSLLLLLAIRIWHKIRQRVIDNYKNSLPTNHIILPPGMEDFAEPEIDKLRNMEDCVLLVFVFEVGGRKFNESFFVRKREQDKFVEFIKYHHSDPGIDLDTATANTFALNMIVRYSFREHRKARIVTCNSGFTHREFDYPVSYTEINEYSKRIIFSRKEEEIEKAKKDYMGKILPLNK